VTRRDTLTIGQLADYVGVTVRAIRHYHARGLLPEPVRDSSGYRRYGAQAVLDLARIKVLTDAGVPLARIDEVRGAGAEQLAEAVAHIDAQLRRQIRELEHRRRRVAGLVEGERMFLPAELAGFLDELRAAGVSPRTVQSERDGWILLFARRPQQALDWLARKRADFAEPEYRRLYRTFDEAAGWDPADPRLEELADAMLRYVAKHAEDDVILRWQQLDDPTLVALLSSHFDSEASPALERLYELIEEKRLSRPQS
jgi:DNA-binding transcriptional MerR regulator